MRRNTSSLPGVPAKDGGNRKNPSWSGKFPLPPNHNGTYGVGNGADGKVVPAKDGGNRKVPSWTGKLPLPPNMDSYNPPIK